MFHVMPCEVNSSGNSVFSVATRHCQLMPRSEYTQVTNEEMKCQTTHRHL